MKCYICLLIEPTREQLLDRNWPPDAMTIINGTAVCAEHVGHLANAQIFSPFNQGVREI